MSTISHLNRERALSNPEAEFANPEALLAEVGLTRGEKIGALRRWADLVERRLAAGNEGMPVNDTEERDAELKRVIGIAKERLEHPGDEPIG